MSLGMILVIFTLLAALCIYLWGGVLFKDVKVLRLRGGEEEENL